MVLAGAGLALGTTLAVLLAASVATSGSASSSSRLGALKQLRGKAGCVSQSGRQGCARGRALDDALDVAVSPDGRSAYVASNDGMAVFSRNRRTGALSQLPGEAGCIIDPSQATEEGFIEEGCARGRALDGAGEVTVSPDGRNVYAGSYGGLAVFSRDPGTGALTQLPGEAGCIIDPSQATEEGFIEEGCARARGLGNSVTVSPDGRNAYVTGDGVGVFARNRRTGALTQLPGAAGCVSNTGRRGCARGRALQQPAALTVSPDGVTVYVAAGFENEDGAGASIAIFSRHRRTGALAQLTGRAGCVSEGGREGCAHARGLIFPTSITVTPDGRNVYVTATWVDEGYVDITTVTIFSRNRRTGELGQLRGRAGCIGDSSYSIGACTKWPANYQRLPMSVTTSPDGRNVYVATQFFDHRLSSSGSVESFARNRRTGALAYLRGRAGCVSRRSVRRRRPQGRCASARGLGDASSVKVSPDGRNVYVATERGVAVFARQDRRRQSSRRLRPRFTG